MKIIFLDIDGVLNNEAWLMKKDRGPLGWPQEDIAPDNVAQLNRITEITGAVIVITSTWRYGRTTKELAELFKKADIKGKVIGKTMVLGTVSEYSMPRGVMIDRYIHDLLPEKPESYVIIDDDSDMLLKQVGVFVKTSMIEGGLNIKNADRAIEILERKK
jgi:histidinol phosphatase-like enzyme